MCDVSTRRCALNCLTGVQFRLAATGASLVADVSGVDGDNNPVHLKDVPVILTKGAVIRCYWVVSLADDRTREVLK